MKLLALSLLAGVLLLQTGLAQKLSKKKVAKNVKNSILESDSDADAYNKFIEAYTDDEDTMLMASTDPVTMRKQKAKEKRAFMKTLRKCRKHNNKKQKGYEMTVNSFAIMDAEERKMFLGLTNDTELLNAAKYESAPLLMSVSSSDLPDSWDWRDEGMMTAVKNQGSCGSCWAFGAVGPLEFAYKKATGQLVSLSEQEFLDCVYEDSGRDGCKGGWYNNAWDLIIDSGHISDEASYPYKGSDGACSHGSHSNKLEGKLQVTGYIKSAKGDETAVLYDLVNQMPLAVAFTVEDPFYSIGSGVYDGCTTTASPNHAVVLTGYGSNYFEIKNSWGEDWGVDGYARLKRGRDICGILSHAYYIEWKDLDSSDNFANDDSSDQAEEEEEADDSVIPCEDHKDDCATWARKGYCNTNNEYYGYMMAYCKSTCGNCLCRDGITQCALYVSRGYCSASYVDYMAMNCPVSCGHCGCNPGYTSTTEGCKLCPKGTYGPGGNSDCVDCPEGYTSPAGATSAVQCRLSQGCQAGYYGSGSTCTMCPANTYSERGATSCERCPSGTTSDAGSTTIDQCTSPSADDCSDNNVNCPGWKDAGNCATTSKYYRYMELNCAKTCGFCVCQDVDPTNCPSWADTGFCKSTSAYYAYMIANCQVSCGICNGGETNECGGGLTMCGDGVCRHIHLC